MTLKSNHGQSHQHGKGFNMGNAILVNPFVFLTANAIKSSRDAVALAENLFSEVPIKDGIDWIYSALSYKPDPAGTLFGVTQRVITFEVAPFSAMDGAPRTRDVMYVDEDGLYNNVNDVWVVVRGAWQPFAGPGLICGTTRGGDTCAPKNINIEWLKQNTVILCQNLIYIPRNGKIGIVGMGSAVKFASKVNMWSAMSTFWTDDDVLG